MSLFEKDTRSLSLEIGGVPEHTAIASSLIMQGNFNKVIQINKRKDLKDKDHNHLAYFNMDALSVDFNDNSFDLCFGAAVMEHINHVDLFLDEMYRILKKDGYLIIHGGSLWNSHWGHHLWVTVEDKKYEFNGYNPLPDWSHLFFSKEEMGDYLKSKNIPIEHIKKIVYWVYDSDEINRLSYDEIVEIIKKSNFKIVEILGENGKELIQHVYDNCEINTKFADIFIVLKK